jgi:hypothetical protein
MSELNIKVETISDGSRTYTVLPSVTINDFANRVRRDFTLNYVILVHESKHLVRGKNNEETFATAGIKGGSTLYALDEATTRFCDTGLGIFDFFCIMGAMVVYTSSIVWAPTWIAYADFWSWLRNRVPVPMVVHNNTKSTLAFRFYYAQSSSMASPALTARYSSAVQKFVKEVTDRKTIRPEDIFGIGIESVKRGVVPPNFNGGIVIKPGEKMTVVEPPYRPFSSRFIVAQRVDQQLPPAINPNVPPPLPPLPPELAAQFMPKPNAPPLTGGNPAGTALNLPPYPDFGVKLLSFPPPNYLFQELKFTVGANPGIRLDEQYKTGGHAGFPRIMSPMWMPHTRYGGSQVKRPSVAPHGYQVRPLPLALVRVLLAANKRRTALMRFIRTSSNASRRLLAAEELALLQPAAVVHQYQTWRAKRSSSKSQFFRLPKQRVRLVL